MPTVDFELKAIEFLPTLENFGFSNDKTDSESVIFFRGGEDAALERLSHYISSGAI